MADSMPGSLRKFLKRPPLKDREFTALPLITTDEDGWPRVALLSAGEVVSLGGDKIVLGLWIGTTTTANLSRSSKGMLVWVDGRGCTSIRLHARRLPATEGGLPDLAVFAADVIGTRGDVVDYATVTSGIRFDLTDPQAVVASWRSTRRMLLRAGRASVPAPHGWRPR